MVLAANGFWLWTILAVAIWVAIAFLACSCCGSKGPQLFRLFHLQLDLLPGGPDRRVRRFRQNDRRNRVLRRVHQPTSQYRSTRRRPDSLGPVDYVVVEFPAGASNFTGRWLTSCWKLVDSGIIRVIDVLILTKDEDGTVDAMELSDVPELGELESTRGPVGGALGRRRRRAPCRCHGPPAVPQECLSGRTCGPRHWRRRRGIGVAN